MTGVVDDRGTPVLHLEIGGREWTAVIDTGFDGHLVLPDALSPHFERRYWGEAGVILGGGQEVTEDLYTIDFPFDGETHSVRVSFAPMEEILIGTAILAVPAARCGPGVGNRVEEMVMVRSIGIRSAVSRGATDRTNTTTAPMSTSASA